MSEAKRNNGMSSEGDVMKFVSNAGSDRVLDLIRPWLKPNHRMDMVSPSFSLYAFAEVLTELPHLSNARLVVPPAVHHH